MPNTRPADALKFRMPEKNQFSIENRDGKHFINLVAFSGKEFIHWWWGRCIFDRNGATIPHERIPIDFNHDSYEALGYLDTFSGNPQLACSGFLTPFKEGDRASEIIFKKEAGVPYQCSVSLGYDGFIEEFVHEGTTAEVNGETVAGPVTIFRKYVIDGVAICLYGSDTNTAVFEKHSINQNQQGDFTMSKETSLDEKAVRETAKKFAKKFGDKRGFKYFADGMSEEEASAAYIEEAGDIDAKDARIAELEKRVAELEALLAEKDARIAELEAQLTANTASTEETPITAEEFKRLQAENLKFKQAAGMSGGESKPVSGGTVEPQKKEFSPLPKGLRLFAEKVKTQLPKK